MLGNLISAGASLLGGILGNRERDQQQERNDRLQRDFAQQGIQWRVNDARAAGVHPLFALGANTHSYAPNSTGDSLGPAIASAGQSIGRAVDTTATGTQKVDTISKAASALTLEKGALENELLRTQIFRMKQQQNPPAATPEVKYLLDGQGETQLPGIVTDGPLKRTGVSPTQPHTEAGAIPDVGYARTGTGYAPVPSADVKERIEDIMPAEWMWFIRNQMMPTAGFNQSPPAITAPDGKVWQFNPLKQEYQLMTEPKWMGRAGKYFRY